MQLAFCEPTTLTGEDVHPLGTRAKVLLTSVFGPYAQDDEYGSRMLNPMELHHNQVTRVQDVYRVCGPVARLAAPVLGRVLLLTISREDKRLRRDWMREPPTYYDKNDQAMAQGRRGRWKASRLQSVVPDPVQSQQAMVAV